MAHGDELLIVEANPGHREGMRKLFEDAGYVCTAVDTVAASRDVVTRKFFPAALVDLDVERPGAGLDLVRIISERSRNTAVVLLTGRRSFEAAVEAARMGVIDVIVKRPDQVDHLRRAVDLACERYRATEGGALLRDVQSVLDDAFGVMLQMARQRYDISVGSGATFKPRILVVDSDPDFLKELGGLVGKRSWEIAAEMSGGAALDKATGMRFDVIACRDELPDLRGSMVVKSLQGTHAESVGLVYSSPGAEGRIERYQGGRAEDVERPFRGASHLIKRIELAVEQLGATQRDRRVIQAFRAEHADFFRRFAELKMRIGRLVE